MCKDQLHLMATSHSKVHTACWCACAQTMWMPVLALIVHAQDDGICLVHVLAE